MATFFQHTKHSIAALLLTAFVDPSIAQPPKITPTKTEPKSAPEEQETVPRDASTTEIEELKKLEASLQESLLSQEKIHEEPRNSGYEGTPPQNNTKLRIDSFSTDGLL